MSGAEDKGAEKQVFISYSHRDADTAKVLAQLCQEFGIKTFLDTNIQYGENWNKQLLKAIQTCNVIVVLISQSSQSKDSWQKREWSAICEQNWTRPEVQVVPIRLDESKLPAFLRQMQVLDGRDRNQLEHCAYRISRFREAEKSSDQLVISGDELEELKDRFRQVIEALSENSSEKSSLNNLSEEGS